MFNLIQWWDNWRHPEHLTIREVEILIEWYDSMDERPERSPFICTACVMLGIKRSKIQKLADWAYDEHFIVTRWTDRCGVFHFPRAGQNQLGWRGQRQELLEAYVDWLYEQGEEE